MRQEALIGTIQMCWMIPEPSIEASSIVWPGAILTEGETFQPRPRSRAKWAPVPESAMPPPPPLAPGILGAYRAGFGLDYPVYPSESVRHAHLL